MVTAFPASNLTLIKWLCIFQRPAVLFPEKCYFIHKTLYLQAII